MFVNQDSFVESFTDTEAGDNAQLVEAWFDLCDQAVVFGIDEHTYDADDVQAKVLGRAATKTFVDDQQIGVCFKRKGNGFGLASIQVFLQGKDKLVVLNGSLLNPRCIEDQITTWMVASSNQLVPDGFRHNDLPVKLMYQVDLPDVGKARQR